jgi:hypothetical protein
MASSGTVLFLYFYFQAYVIAENITKTQNNTQVKSVLGLQQEES